MEKFRDFRDLFEGKVAIVNDKDEYLTIKAGKISFTDNKEMAYVFKNEKEATQWEDDNSNDFDDLTYIKKI